MTEKDIHMRFRDCISINLLLAALDRDFPHFRNVNGEQPVNESGNQERGEVFLKLKAFSTNFPHVAVDEITPIL